MRDKEYRWRVIRLKPAPAVFVGIVKATDEASAMSLAIKQFDMHPEDRDRLLVLRHGWAAISLPVIFFFDHPRQQLKMSQSVRSSLTDEAVSVGR